MSNFVSPGVYYIEKDNSEYTPSLNSSVVGILGFASKGPLNKATLITSQAQLVDTFGVPSEAIQGQALEGALEILEETNTLYFVRAGDAGVEASAGLAVGSCPSVIVSGNDFGKDGGESLYLKIQVYDQAGTAAYATPKEFSIPGGTVGAGGTQADALRAVLGGSLEGDFVGAWEGPSSASGAIVGAWAGAGAYMDVSAYSDSAFTSGYQVLYSVSAPNSGDVDYGMSATAASSLRVFGSTLSSTGGTGTSSVAYQVETLYPGAGYNAGTKSNGDASGLSIQVRGVGSQDFYLDVVEDGAVAESFKGSFVNSGIFIEDVIQTGETNLKSARVKGNLWYEGADANVAKLTTFSDTAVTLFGQSEFQAISDGGTVATATGGRWLKLVGTTTGMSGGDNGIGATTNEKATQLIGDATAEPKTGMQAFDDTTLNIGIALVPGIYTESVQNALITLAESTENFIALYSPPVAVGNVQAAIDWTNGKSSSTAGSRSSAITSSYAAGYYPHVKVFSVFDGKDVWYDPAIFAARQMAYTDSVAKTWFAPAGYDRARLSKPSDVEVKLNQGDRDSMYSGGNVLNPIVSFPQQGIVIFGQRTSQRTPSALDRINVRRMMIYIKKVLLQAAQKFIFEPNDEFTWAQIEAVTNPFLDDIRRQRGITEFKVICDDTVNTPVRVDRNELWCKVLLKPTKTAEVIIFEINLTNQSANLGNI